MPSTRVSLLRTSCDAPKEWICKSARRNRAPRGKAKMSVSVARPRSAGRGDRAPGGDEDRGPRLPALLGQRLRRASSNERTHRDRQCHGAVRAPRTSESSVCLRFNLQDHAGWSRIGHVCCPEGQCKVAPHKINATHDWSGQDQSVASCSLSKE